jgi:hypothetical protein
MSLVRQQSAEKAVATALRAGELTVVACERRKPPFVRQKRNNGALAINYNVNRIGNSALVVPIEVAGL